MALGLDLSECRTKLARAAEHLDTLEREAAFAFHQAGPYHGRLGEADEKTGWHPILVRRKDIPEPTQQRLSVIVGDVLHNLRCTLDYIVSSLVAAADIPVESIHQFPIFDQSTDYADKVWRKGDKVGRGNLRGVKHGLVQIESIQPYNTKPVLERDTLWTVNRFSNHDKHRSMTAQFNDPGQGPIHMGFGNAEPADFRQIPPGNWDDNGEMQLGSVRFVGASPDPSEVNINGDLATDVWFTVGPNKRDKFYRAVKVGNFREACHKVGLVVNLFEKM